MSMHTEDNQFNFRAKLTGENCGAKELTSFNKESRFAAPIEVVLESENFHPRN